MYSGTGNTTSLVLGFPIRTSSDQRSVDSSPRLIAASYVLHRLSMPRHPPCALKHLQHKKPKMSKNCTSDTHNKAHTLQRRHAACCVLDARNHYPQIKHHTPPPRWSDKQTQTPSPNPGRARTVPVSHHGDGERAGLLPQSPIVCLAVNSPKRAQSLLRTRPPPTTGARPSSNRLNLGDPRYAGRPRSRGAP